MIRLTRRPKFSTSHPRVWVRQLAAEIGGVENRLIALSPRSRESRGRRRLTPSNLVAAAGEYRRWLFALPFGLDIDRTDQVATDELGVFRNNTNG